MKSFENTALEIIKAYIDMKERHASRTGMIFDPEYDYNISSPENMACTVNRLADTLAANYRHRAVQWDKENFDREVEKMLTQENE